MTTETIHETVRQHYADAAVRASQGSSCCSDPETIGANLYSALERDELPDAAVLASLGCGNPTAVADLHPGERVLDLGSGGGIDVLLSAKRVGPTGRAFGVDMTDEMLALAQANAAQAGATNVEFLKGHIEALPLPAESIDVVISNCVVNLAADKHAVFAEIARVLRPGGRIGISDIVAEDSLSPERARRARLLRRLHRGRAVRLRVPRGPAGGRPDRRHDHAVAHGHRRDDQRHHQGDEAGRCATAHRPCGAARDAPGRRGRRLLRRHRLLLMGTRRVGGRSAPDRRSPRVTSRALILAATCWGVGTVISKAALAEISPFTLLPIQLAASLAILAVLMRSSGDLVPDRRLAAARPARPPQPGSRVRARPDRADDDHRQPVCPAVGPRAADDPVPGRLVPARADHAGLRRPVAHRGRRHGRDRLRPVREQRAVDRGRPDPRRDRLLCGLLRRHTTMDPGCQGDEPGDPVPAGPRARAGHRARPRGRPRRRPGRADCADTARARQRRSARAPSTTPAPTGSTSAPCATFRPRTRRSRST